jgi:uncharacterized protein
VTPDSPVVQKLLFIDRNAHFQSYSAGTGLGRCAFIFLLGISITIFSGCNKKSRSTSSQIRSITREFISAGRKAGNGRAEISTRPEYNPREPGSAQVLAADRIYIAVNGPDDTLHNVIDAIDKEFARVAKAHRLQRVNLPGAPGTERFDYTLNGRRTHWIEINFSASSASSGMASQRPRLAIIIDDLGRDHTQADILFRLSYPLTLSVLPYLHDSTAIAQEAHRRGYHVMLHLPMASTGGKKDEAIELHPGMDSRSVGQTFASMLNSVPYAGGVNNHEGSLGTSDRDLMGELMPLLRQRNLYFVDSRTTAATVAEIAAQHAGVPTTSRNVFLDDEQSVGSIRKQLALAIHDAKEKGSALAIGHPHQETLQVLAEMLPEAQREGVALVFASDLAR